MAASSTMTDRHAQFSGMRPEFADKSIENGLKAGFPLEWAVIATLFSAFIGVIFGLFPAVSASKLDPIVALRYE